MRAIGSLRGIHTLVCDFRPVLEYRIYPRWVYLDGLHRWLQMVDEWCVLGGEKQRKVIRLSQVGEGGFHVGSSDVYIDIVQSFVPSGVARAMLIKYGKHSLEVGVVQVTRHNECSHCF